MMSTPASSLNNSAARCWPVPGLADANSTLPGLRFR
ncbi:Uncharacterised protein [Bordetella pertussis]|nr:Uncharacterised protein [Bordetella pertussis]